MIEITKVKNRRELNAFIRFPHQLYRNDPHYVPVLNALQREQLSPRHNPFFGHSEAAYFLARRGGRTVGRVAAIVNRIHLLYQNDGAGFFGFFDVENGLPAARALLAAAAGYLREFGLKTIIGPENFTTNESVGVLSRGFDSSPMPMMPYNFPYYKDLLLASGFSPLMELYSYYISQDKLPAGIHEKAAELENRLGRKGIAIRPIDFGKFDADISGMRLAYNEANEGNWGFVPLSEGEFAHMARDLRRLVAPENVLLAEAGSRIIGYLVSLPDINQLFKKVRDGKLLPFGWIHLLAGWRKAAGMRILILGVIPAFRKYGIDWCLYSRIARYAQQRGVKGAEACYVMKSNAPMARMMERLNGEIVKAYLLFEAPLGRLLE